MCPVPPASDPAVVSPQLLRGWALPEPEDEGDKHERGTVLVVGGAVSTPGAVLLAGLAALRVGAGRLQVATVSDTSVALSVALPEAMVRGLDRGDDGSLSPLCVDEVAGAAGSAAAVVIGPGLLGDGVRPLLEGLLPRISGAAVVLDAVALTAVSGAPALLAPLEGSVVLTPNSGELAALLEGQDREGEDAARWVAERYGAVVAVRGWVATPGGDVWADEAGGIGLGTSGSGDVLAGAVGGLLARGATPAQAAVWGQYLHAAAGDRLAARVGRVGFLARELLDELPMVLTGLRS
jgi:ADP-dependent NAD(P)H-hydrate dehydratase